MKTDPRNVETLDQVLKGNHLVVNLKYEFDFHKFVVEKLNGVLLKKVQSSLMDLDNLNVHLFVLLPAFSTLFIQFC